ncbi:c-type cytochrome [Pelagibacterium limicola]|uniref:c-type cytochrome n=1 Tax=Pelagibacterium limicola TaxID=2791022 RepID=UPI0018AFD42E|nr:cytochrome c [Pelagibacterium limicola]
MKHRFFLYAGCVVAILGFGAGIAIDRDPSGMFSGRLQAQTGILSEFDQAGLSDEQRGAIYFAFGDFSALSSEALEVSAAPWKLSTALLALYHSNGDLETVTSEAVAGIFQDYGFVTPARIANWPDGLPVPQLDAPIGQNLGFASRLLPPIGVTISNVSCAACHASVVYDASGQPDLSTVWLGTPNGSINLERYVSELYKALRDRPEDEGLIWAAVQKLYPQTDWREWLALRSVVLPRVDGLVASQEAKIGRLLPFEVSTMGATNGLQALQSRFGLLANDHLAEVNAPISVPELGGRIWRSSLLASGAYGVPGEDPQRHMHAQDLTEGHINALAGLTAFFTVPSMGTSPATAAQHVDDAERIFAWLQNYRPQPFPGPIDRDAAERGRQVYAAACASCHGSYSVDIERPELVNFPNWQGDVGTDRTYIEMFDQATVDMVNGLGYDSLLQGRLAPDYVAQPLTGLWSSAPYLHNGSVPTLWHLMRPNQRPIEFDVGGHALDLEKVGIAGVQQGDVWATPSGYTPWARPERIDTTVPGLGAEGHKQPFDTMSEPDKADLLEYLKLL